MFGYLQRVERNSGYWGGATGEGINVNKHIKITITGNKLSYLHDATFLILAAVKSERKTTAVIKCYN